MRKTQFSTEQLDLLRAELAAIELWDRDYLSARKHPQIDDDAYQDRQVRRVEIVRDIAKHSRPKDPPAATTTHLN